MYQQQTSSAGPPFYKNKVDIWMRDSALWWFSIIWLALLTIGFLVYVGVMVNSQPFEHSYVKNPGAPGILSSQRYTLNWIVVSLSIFAVGLLLFFILLLIIVRKNYGCHMIWFLLSVIMLAIVIFAIVTLAIQYGDCNDADQPTNLCNDFRWCCVHAADPANECPNFVVCPGVLQSDLAPNDQFLGLFWTLVTLTVMYLIWFIVMLVYWFSPAPEEEFSPEASAPDEEQLMQEQEAPVKHRVRYTEVKTQNPRYSTSPPLKSVVVDWDSAGAGVRKRHK